MLRLANLGIVASIVLLSVVAAGCGGGARSGPLPQHEAAATTTARLTIVIPAKSSSSASRGPKYISAATQSMTFNVTPQGSSTSVSGYPQTVNLTPTSTGCTSTLASTQCSIMLALAPGSYDAGVTTFDQTGGAGNALSAAQAVPFTVNPGVQNTISISLGGLATSVAIVPDASAFSGSLTYGLVLPHASSGAVSVFGVDADGNYILGAGAPTVTLTSSDTTVASVTAPSTAAPNRFSVTTVANGPAAAQLVAAAAPVAGSGGSAVSATVYFSSTPPVVMTLNATTTNVIELNSDGSLLGLPTGAFSDPAELAAASMTYGPAGTIVQSNEGGSGGIELLDFNLSGSLTAQQTLSGITNVAGAVYDPHNGLTYFVGLDVNNQNVTTTPVVTAVDAAGNQQTFAGGFTGFSEAIDMTFDPQNNLLYLVTTGGVLTYDESGVRQSIPAFGSNANSIAYGGKHGWLYTVNSGSGGPTGGMVAYDANGVQQSASITGLTQPLRITYNPGSGLLYIFIGGNNTMLIATQDGVKLNTVNPTSATLFGAIP